MEFLAAGHIHSDWSYDGSFSLERLAEVFAGRRYRILLMTEHDRNFSQARFREFRDACSLASSSRILLVPGIEYSDPDNRVHILTWGLDYFLGENLTTANLLAEVHASGGVAVLAHPSRKEAWSVFDPEWTKYLWGIEAWNRKYDGWAPSASAPGLLETTQLHSFAGLDFHTSRQLFPLAMALDIEGELCEASVLDSLRDCRCEARAFGRNLSLHKARLPLIALRAAEQSRRAARILLKSVRGGSRKPGNVHA